MASQGLKVVFGAASIGNREPWIETSYNEKAFDILLKHGVNTLDSAQLYGESEKRLGELNAGEKFIIDTKWMGGWQPGWATKENIINSAKSSIEKLKVKQVSWLFMPEWPCQWEHTRLTLFTFTI
jgi:aryl-alcohol dehydrogenase-like predicted oxidoreductase